MDQIPENTQPTMCPFLGYQDVPAAIAWLSATFGFKLGATVPSSGSPVVHAEMHVGNGVIILESAKQKTTWNVPATHGIYIYVGDVEGYFRRAQEAGAKVVRTIEDTIWEDGTRSFRVLDPEGYQWRFGNYQPSTDGR